MKIPKKLKIGGQIYRVIERDRNEKDGTDNLATSKPYRNKIWIDNSQPQSQKESTFLHEIIEIINSLYKLEFKESDICTLETALYQVLKDNKLLA